MPPVYGAEETKYIQQNNIHYLLDDLCKELVIEQPGDHKQFIVDFLKKKQAAEK